MAWTYSGDPSTSSKDAVRFLIGDTDTTDQQMQDEEINYLLTLYGGDVYTAAIVAARSLASKYARFPDVRIGDYSTSNSQRFNAYLALAKQLEQTQNVGLIHKAKPYAGGISIADKQQDEQNTDRVKPAFTRQDMTFPGNDDYIREE